MYVCILFRDLGDNAPLFLRFPAQSGPPPLLFYFYIV